jgi:hypothetical protein
MVAKSACKRRRAHSVWPAPTGWILVKFGIWELSKNRENPNFVKTRKKYRIICTKNKYFYCCRRHKIAIMTLLTAISNGATQKERIVGFPWQRLCDNNTVSRYIIGYVTTVNIVLREVRTACLYCGFSLVFRVLNQKGQRYYSNAPHSHLVWSVGRFVHYVMQ